MRFIAALLAYLAWSATLLCLHLTGIKISGDIMVLSLAIVYGGALAGGEA